MNHQPTDGARVQPPVHPISCTLCRQRKVKCDKRERCSNCVKSGAECVYLNPARPRRRLGNGKSPEDVSREELIRRVRQYEALFRKHGLQVQGSDRDSAVSVKSIPEPDPTINTTGNFDELQTEQHRDREGTVSRVPQQAGFWAEDLSVDILEDFFDEDSPDGATEEASLGTASSLDLSLAFHASPSTESLTSLHPPVGQIFRLWEIFLSNFDPLVKIIHVPTVQRHFLQATVDLENVSKGFEALMFAIYAAAITSVSNEQCLELTGDPKSELLDRYHRITQRALTRARLLGTTDVVVLQAAVLFLHGISLASESNYGDVYILTGIILRIGERMGLHRKVYPANLSAIESQTRRRLWWHIIVLDSRSTQASRVDTPINTEYWGSVLPLNVNDSELTPEMMVEPRGHVGCTEMSFRLMMFEIGKFLRYSDPGQPFRGGWEKMTAPSISLAEKDKMIDDLEQTLELKYLKYCDPVIPLHILARCFASIVISRMRLTIRHPRRLHGQGLPIPEDQKQKPFDICLSILEQDNFLHATDCLRGFSWPLNQELHVDAFVYLLSELRYRDASPLNEKAWSEISKTFRNYPKILSTRSPLNVAIGKLTLRSWENWEAQAQHQGFRHQSRPDFILKLLEKLEANTTKTSPGFTADLHVTRIEWIWTLLSQLPSQILFLLIEIQLHHSCPTLWLQ